MGDIATEIYLEKRTNNFDDDLCDYVQVHHYSYPIPILDLKHIQCPEDGEYHFYGNIDNILVYNNAQIFGKLVNKNNERNMTIYVGNTTEFGRYAHLLNFQIVYFDEDLEKISTNSEIPYGIKKTLISRLAKSKM
jgi:hypothetical protein